MKAILIDDEQQNIINLSSLLSIHCPNIIVIGTAKSVAEAYDLIQQNTPDVVFLDIQMPSENGFDLLKKFTKIEFEVIFVTAFDLYGIQAVKFSALDYLLKPIDINELKMAVDKLTIKLNDVSKLNLIENLKNQLKFPTQQELHKIALPSLHETHLVKTTDIIYCKSDNSYTTFYLQNGTNIVVCKSIKEYEMLLNEYGFIRVHQSYLVNKEYVKSISKKDGVMLLLTNGIQIAVSRNRRDEVLQKLL